MSDLILFTTLAVSVLIIVLLFMTLWRGRNRSQNNDNEEVVRPQRRVLPNINTNDGMRRRPVRHNRIPINQNNDDNDVIDEDNEELDFDNELPVDGKIGTKKRKKLEMKAEKRLAREKELEERLEKKEKLAKIEELRRIEEEKAKQEELKRLEEERLAKEEKERQEHEEYLKLKESFAVEEEGYDEEADESEAQNKLVTFIDYIKSQKVVLMEELAAHFHMKTQDVITRVQELLAQELIVGVIDDRGKFIYITKDELESVAKFIRQRGRVSISELVESSNSLINLTPLEKVSA